MRVRSPIVTLLVGLLVAVVVWILSVRANETNPYSAATPAVVWQ